MCQQQSTKLMAGTNTKLESWIKQNKSQIGQWRLLKKKFKSYLVGIKRKKKWRIVWHVMFSPFGLRIFCWCGQTSKGLQSFFFFVSGYSRFLLPLTYLSNIHWWKCLNWLNLKEFNYRRNIRIQRWFSSVRS